MTAEALARLAKKTLEAVRENRRAPHDPALRACARDFERRLEAACQAVLDPPRIGLYDGQE